MTSQDSSFRQSGSQESRIDCDPVVNPPINRWVIWNEADNDWDVSDSPAPKPKKKRPIVLAEESGPHEIRFHLKVPAQLGWRFDPARPIWTEDNVKCGGLTGLDSDQISVVDCNPHLLTIRDANDDEARLVRYQLNFVDKDGNKGPPACDPAILNGGGGRI